MQNSLTMERLILGTCPVQSTVCGESVEQLDGTENARPRFVIRGPGVTSGHGWGQPRPWVGESFSNDQPGPSNALLRKKPKYDSCLKRTIPYVSLATDSSGKSVCVDSTVSNVYIKIPDDVCTQTILSDIAAKIGADDKELTLLDSKFVPVMDDDDKGLTSLIFIMYIMYLSLCIH